MMQPMMLLLVRSQRKSFHAPDISWVVSAIIPACLLALWYIRSLNWPLSPQFATPYGVLQAFYELWAKGDLLKGMIISLQHVLTGFALAVSLGSIIGLLMGYLPGFNEWMAPLIHTLRSVAPYAWLPLAILWFGVGDKTVISIVSYSAFFPMLVNAYTGARKADRKLVDAAHALGANNLTLFVRVLFPAALPSLLVGARLAMGSAWIAVVAAEMASTSQTGGAASGGLGQMMYSFYAYVINLNFIVVCILIVGMLALVSDRLLAVAYRILTPWAQR